MKTYKHIFESAASVENIKASIQESTKKGGKKNRPEVQRVLAHLDKEAKKTHELMLSHSYKFETYQMEEITEGIKQKSRKIAKPKFCYDQMIQVAMITELKKIVMHSLYEHAHGSLDGRGPKQSADVISKWLRKDKRGTRYCLQMDVHHCYPSVNQELLIQKYHEVIKDEDFNIENDKIIRASPAGLAPGAPTSVWHIHFLFTPLDHWIVGQDGVSHYLRHADDIVIFGPNKKKLHKVEQGIIDYMHREYGIEINHNHQVFPIEWEDKKKTYHGRPVRHGRPLDVCGYLFYRDRTILREAHLLKTTRKANRIAKKENPTHYDASQLLSHLGWMKYTDTHDIFSERIKPVVSVREMKRMISRHSRKENKKKDDMEKHKRLREAERAGNRENNDLSPEEH